MFGLFGRRENRERKAVRLEFDNMVAELGTASQMHQASVGHSINLANSAFLRRFGSTDKFRALPRSIKMEYVHVLTKMEEELARSDLAGCIGHALFKKWVGALALEDADLEKHFLQRLAELSHKSESYFNLLHAVSGTSIPT